MSDLPAVPEEIDLEGLASVDDVIASALTFWRPPPKLSVSEWADRKFYLSAESAATPGPWKTLPYQKGWLDAISDPHTIRVSLMKCSRVGYTKCIDVAIGFGIEHDPCSQLVVQPTIEDAKGFSKEEIGPMLRDVPSLAAINVEDEQPEPGKRKGPEETILQKFYPGGVLSLVGANSGAGLRRISRKRVFCDEVDAYPPSAGQDGDPVELAFRRAETYWDRKEVLGSTPLVAGTSRIERSYLEGDQRRFFVPCPHCNTFAILSFKRDGGGHYLVFDEEKPEAAHFACAVNGCVIEHKDKRGMVERGEWRAAKPFKGHASFHIWAAYSFSPNATWADIVKAFVKAKNAGPELLRTFVNTWLGETWKELGEAPAWEHLYARREVYSGVPAGVVVLTCGVDVQKDRLIYEVVGWAPGRESWSVEIGVLPGDTAQEETWAQLDDLLERSWDSARGPMVISKMAVDSGYNTQHVYSWVRLKDPRRVMAIKGVAKQIATLQGPSHVDVTYRGKRYARGCKVWKVGVDSLKSELYGFLRLFKGEGPTPNGYCHFSEAHGEDYFKQLTGEHLVSITNKRTKFTVHEWQLQPGRENHYLDCRVYARAAATSIGLDRMKAPKRDEPTTSAAALVAEAVAAAPVKAAPLAPKPPPKVRDSDSRFQFRRKYGSGWLKR